MYSISKYLKLVLGLIFSCIGFLFYNDQWGNIFFILGLLLTFSFFTHKQETVDNIKINNDKLVNNKTNKIKTPKNEKREKDKKIGLFGIGLFFMSMVGIKMLTYSFEYLFFSKWIDVSIFIILGLFGLHLSKKYFITVFIWKNYH